jgi:hypothetical protein
VSFSEFLPKREFLESTSFGEELRARVFELARVPREFLPKREFLESKREFYAKREFLGELSESFWES